jgi:hypothetical protein
MNIVQIITSAIMEFSNYGTQGKNIYLTTTKFIEEFTKFIGDSKTNIRSALAGGSGIIQSVIDLVTSIQTQISNFASFIFSIMTEMYSNSIINQTIDDLKSWLFGKFDKTVNSPQIDPRVQEEIKNIIDTLRKNGIQNEFTSYYFDEKTGKLVYTGNPVKITTVLSSNENHYIKSVQMITEKDKSIHYFINNQEIDINSSTLIQSKPVHTGLVFAYMAKNFSYLNRTMPSKYVYYYGDDGNIKVHLKKSDGSCGEEVSTVSKAIIEQINGQDDSALKNIKVVCEEMFGVKNGLNNDVCSKHFYSILGKSALGMIENLGLAIKSNNEIANILLSANPGIQYEILKNLDWKMKKKSDGSLQLVNVDSWLEQMKNSSNLGIKYEQYLNNYPDIKKLLNNIVSNINSHQEILVNKLKSTNIDNNNLIKKKKRRLSINKINNLKILSLEENLRLQNGGNKFPTNKLLNTYEIMQSQLSNFNKKLSSITKTQIDKKINTIIQLEQEINNIYNKILEYVQILKKNRNLIINGKKVTIDDINDLINQYNLHNNNYNKKLITLSTAFGKIQISIDSMQSNKSNDYSFPV